MGREFLQGNEACASGAIAAGCRFFAGYPITPATEITEQMALKLPKAGGVFIQMEDEIASIASCIGASWAGARAMTATSGPGFSLMQENIGYAAMTETPLVIIDVQRGGPSTGQPTLPSQGDVMQARWGSHGDYEIIALAPNGVQEMFDLTVRAFNLADKYRVPVILLSDGIIGHMREDVDLPERVPIKPHPEPVERPLTTPYFCPGWVPKFPTFGKGYKVHISGLSHTGEGYPEAADSAVAKELIPHLCDKIRLSRLDLCETETINPDAETVIVAYGTPARAAYDVVMGRKDLGLLRLKTIWPLPEEAIREVAEGASRLLVLEMNMGQLFHEIKMVALEAGNPNVYLFPRVGGILHTPEDILAKVEEIS